LLDWVFGWLGMQQQQQQQTSLVVVVLVGPVEEE
jgi:hypothetical protein